MSGYVLRVLCAEQIVASFWLTVGICWLTVGGPGTTVFGSRKTVGIVGLTVGGPGTTVFDGGKTVGIFPVTVAVGPNLSKLQTVGYFFISVGSEGCSTSRRSQLKSVTATEGVYRAPFARTTIAFARIFRIDSESGIESKATISGSIVSL